MFGPSDWHMFSIKKNALFETSPQFSSRLVFGVQSDHWLQWWWVLCGHCRGQNELLRDGFGWAFCWGFFCLEKNGIVQQHFCWVFFCLVERFEIWGFQCVLSHSLKSSRNWNPTCLIHEIEIFTMKTLFDWSVAVHLWDSGRLIFPPPFQVSRQPKLGQELGVVGKSFRESLSSRKNVNLAYAFVAELSRKHQKELKEQNPPKNKNEILNQIFHQDFEPPAVCQTNWGCRFGFPSPCPWAWSRRMAPIWWILTSRPWTTTSFTSEFVDQKVTWLMDVDNWRTQKTGDKTLVERKKKHLPRYEVQPEDSVILLADDDDAASRILNQLGMDQKWSKCASVVWNWEWKPHQVGQQFRLRTFS